MVFALAHNTSSLSVVLPCPYFCLCPVPSVYLQLLLVLLFRAEDPGLYIIPVKAFSCLQGFPVI